MDGIPKGFKAIPGFPGYHINKIGEVWSCQKRGRRAAGFLKPAVNSAGYLQIVLYKNSRRTHKKISILILETFVGRRPKGFEGCHKNDNKIDDRLKNLYWGTHSDNAKDAFRNGRRCTKGEHHAQVKLNVLQVKIIRYLANYPKEFTQKEISKMFGISLYTISDIKLRKTWKHL